MWCRSEKRVKKKANVSAFGDTNIIIIVREILQHFILFAFYFFGIFYIRMCVCTGREIKCIKCFYALEKGPAVEPDQQMLMHLSVEIL